MRKLGKTDQTDLNWSVRVKRGGASLLALACIERYLWVLVFIAILALAIYHFPIRQPDQGGRDET